MNIATMTTKQWYRALLEDKLLMTEDSEDSPAALIPIKIESLHPTTDWALVWQSARLKGVGSELISFVFKMTHRLLPSQDRVARLRLAEDQAGLCLLCRLEVETLSHCFFECPMNMQVGLALLGCVQRLVPDLSPEAAVRLDFGISLSEEDNLAAVCILSTGLKYIWETRVAKKVVMKYKMRAEVEARVSILRRTRFQLGASKIAGLLDMLS